MTSTSSTSQHEILVSLASKNRIVPYDLLMTSLGIGNERELEDFIIQAIYQGIIKGKLNPVKQCLEVIDWGAFCVENLDMDFMTQTLEEWSNRCGEFVNLLTGQVDGANKFVAECNANEKRITDEVETIKKVLASADDSTVQRKLWSGIEGTKSILKPETKRFKSGGPKLRRGGKTDN
ncbi:hypothetical protein ACQ4LE_008801 [Meloidogyne hapla]|uniref:PCI domain-containing protein n=1 Tax=Meloidogyne hapla TaxID=6305 RepID=A0A1I8BQP7_MELHA